MGETTNAILITLKLEHNFQVQLSLHVTDIIFNVNKENALKLLLTTFELYASTPM